MKNRKPRPGKRRAIVDYDEQETSSFVDPSRRLRLEDIGLKLPKVPPTQVVSLRLPSELLNELRALGSAKDVPYQALIKLMLAEGIARFKKKAA